MDQKLQRKTPANPFDGVRTFSATMARDREMLGEKITEWIKGWKARGWRTAAKEPVKNADLWKLLDEEVKPHEIQWVWVRGHSGHNGNERADALANKGVETLS